MRASLVAIVVLLGLCSGTFAQELRFTDVPMRQRLNDRSFYADVINHCGTGNGYEPYLSASRPTNTHESTHGINSMMRNAQRGGKFQALYVGDGKCVLIREPNLRKSIAVQFIPQSLRSLRYRTYVLNTEWDDTPTYLLDEWVAYTNGLLTAIDDHNAGKSVEQADWACGPLELGVYSIALAMAVKDRDPNYWQTETQFRGFMKFNWKRSKDAFNQASKLFPSQEQDRLIKALVGSADAKAIREFIAAEVE